MPDSYFEIIDLTTGLLSTVSMKEMQESPLLDEHDKQWLGSMLPGAILEYASNEESSVFRILRK